MVMHKLKRFTESLHVGLIVIDSYLHKQRTVNPPRYFLSWRRSADVSSGGMLTTVAVGVFMSIS